MLYSFKIEVRSALFIKPELPKKNIFVNPFRIFVNYVLLLFFTDIMLN